MKDRKLAVRYARALLSVFPDASAADPADRFLLALRDAMLEAGELHEVLLDPAFPRSARKGLLRGLAEERGLPRTVLGFLDTLVDNNRVAALPTIAEVFHEEREKALGVVPAEFITATPIDQGLRDRAQAAIERMTGRRVRLTASVDPQLLGGAVTRIGSMVYDGSLRTQLARLRSKMSQE